MLSSSRSSSQSAGDTKADLEVADLSLLLNLLVLLAAEVVVIWRRKEGRGMVHFQRHIFIR